MNEEMLGEAEVMALYKLAVKTEADAQSALNAANAVMREAERSHNQAQCDVSTMQAALLCVVKYGAVPSERVFESPFMAANGGRSVLRKSNVASA